MKKEKFESVGAVHTHTHTHTHTGNLKNKKGITLVALVVTIIILLILAGISIVSITGSGLFEKATYASKESSKAQALEDLKLKVLQVQADKQGSATLQDVVNALNLDKQNEYIVSLNQIASITGEIPNVGNSSEIYVIYKNYQFKIDSNLVVTFIGEYKNNTQILTNKTRYLLVEVNGYLENEDCAVINEITIYNKHNEKINYTILKDLEYDSATDDKSEYWENMSSWNFTNINDGEYTYTSNYPSGAQNCTIFLSGTNTNIDSWARFIIDLGEEIDIGQIRVCIGGYDELSPCNSRTPKKIKIYSIDNFVDGTEENSTYTKNIILQNNDGLTLIKEKEFSEILLVPTWIELLDDNLRNYIKARYLLVEVNGYLENEDGAVVNDISIYDKYNEKIDYTILNDLEYDSATKGKSEYWEDMRYWNYTNLNDGESIYTSNAPSGNQNCTLFLYGTNTNTNSWARFIIDLGEEQNIGQILLYVGGYDELSPCNSRTPKEVSFYKVNNFINDTGENTTYNKNIIQKNNDGLTLISNRIFQEILTTSTEIKLLDQ